MDLLEVSELRVSFGHVEALRGVSLTMSGSDSCIALVGPNGAGKSTFVNALTGLLPWEGDVRFRGDRIRGLSNRELVRRGLVQCPERRYLFDYMSVKDNLLLGSYNAGAHRTFTLREVYELFPVLEERKGQQACTLSGGEAQMLAIGRSLMSSPRLLILDEPTLGLAPILRKKLTESLREIVKLHDTAVILVEQNVKVSFDVAERVYVIRQGRIVKQGPADELSRDPEIRRTFFGV